MERIKIILATFFILILAFLAALQYQRKDIGKYVISGEGYVLNSTTGELLYRVDYHDGKPILRKVNMNTGAVTEIKMW